MSQKIRLMIPGILLTAAMILLQVGCTSTPAPQQNVAENASPTPADAAMTTDGQEPGAAGVGSQAPGGQTSGGVSSGLSGSRPGSPPVSQPAPPPPPRTFTIAAGTPITVWTAEEISTKTARPGQSFSASLANPIVDGDWVIAQKGAPVEGVIVSSDPGGRVKGVASISIRLQSLTLADGSRVDISTGSYTKQAKKTLKKDAIKTGIGAGVGAAIGAIAGGGKGAAIGAGAGAGAGAGVVMATRGDPAVIAGETQLSFRLRSPVTVTKQ
ncbi:MAG: hypothetical protein IPM66_04765 [Acidobacteriota bacterium]|nr:MAG: hypothetical protein IPM66_04765 [Acidobacteriota bacterium]